MKTLRFFILLSLFAIHQLHAQKPEIISVNKSTSTLGEMVTISGNGFSSTASNNAVFFGASKAEVTKATASTLEVLAPAGATFAQISVTNLTSRLTGYSAGKYLLNFNGFQALEPDRLLEKIEYNEESGLFDVCVCDFNGDGLNDFMTTNNADRNYSLTPFVNTTTSGQSTISFQRLNPTSLLIGDETRNVACGDLDGDGKPDLVAGKGGSSADRLYLFRNTTASAGAQVNFSGATVVNVNVGNSPSSTRNLKIHDMDNDGKPDIIMTDQRNSYVHVFKNNSIPGDLRFNRDDRVLISSPDVTLGLDIADVNNDGKPDIIFGKNLSPDVYVVINRSNNGRLIFDEPMRIAVSGQMMNLAAVDIDMDGDMDIVVANYVNNVYVLLNESTSNSVRFSTPRLYETGRLPFGLDIGDINGDGKPDIVVTTNEATEPLTILENRSSNGTLSLYQYSAGVASPQNAVKVADFSGDGKPDIVYTINNVNRVAVVRNQHCVGAEIGPVPPNKICADNPSVIKATRALNVNYTWRNVTLGQDYETNEWDFAASTPGEYQVRINSTADNCENTSSVLNILPGGASLPPTPVITGPELVCVGEDFTLDAGLVSGVNYIWQAPNGNTYEGPALQVQNAQSIHGGTYSLMLEEDGCRTDPTTHTVDISVVPNLEVTASQGEYFCEGTQNVLSTANIMNGVYLWYRNGQPITGSNSHEFSVAEDGNYSVRFTNLYQCTNLSPAFNTSKVTAPQASFEANENSCLGQLVKFTNTSATASGVNVQYLWDFGNDNISFDESPSFNFLSQGTYNVSLTVNYGNDVCSSTYDKTINMGLGVDINIMIDDIIPPGKQAQFCPGDTLKLSVEPEGSSLVWGNGSTSQSIQVYESGEYTVSAVVNNSHCTSTDAVTLSLLPGINLDLENTDVRIKKGETVQLVASGADFYDWEPAETLDYPNIPDPVASPQITTVYTVTGSNEYECTQSASVQIVVEGDRTVEVIADKVFTPNEDGMNDTWQIENLDIFNECAIIIMNRNGQKVYEADKYDNDWRATFNGKELPSETYYYILKCNANEIHTGSITVMR